MRFSTLFPVVLATAISAIKTSIYIDQVPGYSALAACAEDRLSAIVRGQSSGCGDKQELTSFTCFCTASSSKMSSIISTAVQHQCSAQAMSVLASLTAPLPEVTAALAVFDSYCARSTELAWYQANGTSSSSPIVTPAASSTIAASTSSSTSSSSAEASSPGKTVPVAAIAAPVVIGVFVIVGVVGLLFFLRRRKASKATAKEDSYAPAIYTPRVELEHGAVHEVQGPVQEMVGDTVKYQHELDTRPVELDGNLADARR